MANTLLNLCGQGIPLLVAVVTMPVLVRSLGPGHFGILSLAWVMVSSLSIFDLGLGRATTKYVSDAMGTGRFDKIRALAWSAVLAQAMLGGVGAACLVGGTPLLVHHALKIPAALVPEAEATFRTLAFAVPIVLVSSSVRGLLEAVQRFDLVNAVRIPYAASAFLVPLLGVWLGWSLPSIVLGIIACSLGALVGYSLLAAHAIPTLRKAPVFEVQSFRHLLSFGSWIMVSNVVGPVLTYFDRFAIGSLISISAVGYYSAPYELVTRLWILPNSLVATLFPTFSALAARGDRPRLAELFPRMMNYLFLVVGSIVAVLVP
ncbi:MAG: oligosaccharide flippase family protein, partial [bacterium]